MRHEFPQSGLIFTHDVLHEGFASRDGVFWLNDIFARDDNCPTVDYDIASDVHRFHAPYEPTNEIVFLEGVGLMRSHWRSEI